VVRGLEEQHIDRRPGLSKRDRDRFPHARTADGRAVELLSASYPATDIDIDIDRLRAIALGD
jgi:hypothetical protein